MGYGGYSVQASVTRAHDMGYHTKSTAEVFKSRSINSAMNPYGLKVRESRDSDEHPNSLPIIISLDVTGSMGSIPHFLVKEGLPSMMADIMDSGVKDPQVLFLGIGDHQCDDAPIQVGQFESSDELMDKWLTTVFLEGGGGGNEGESYLLAWYLAAKHTSIDSIDKRGKRGYLFTIGDEPTLNGISKNSLKDIFGPGEYSDYTAAELIELASKQYNLYHLHIAETYAGGIKKTFDGWRELLGNNVIKVLDKRLVSGVIAEILSLREGNVKEKVIKTDNNGNVEQEKVSKAEKLDIFI